MNTEKTDRKQRYYQKHRNKILKSLKDKRKPSKQEPVAFVLGRAFQRISSLVLQFIWQIIRQDLEKLLLAFLVLNCTGFLVFESARTLAAIEGDGAFWKAMLCELVLVGASMLVVSTRTMQILRSVVLVSITALSLLNTIGGPLTHLSQARQNAQLKAEEVLILDRTTEQKQTLLVRYLATDRISGARRIESEIASLSDRMTQVKRELAGQKSESILALGFGITVLFRLVIMAANIVFANRLGHLIRENRVPTRTKLVLVRT